MTEAKTEITKELLLYEVEELLRIVPARETLRHPTTENLSWLGRVSAMINRWKSHKEIPLGLLLSQLRSARRDSEVSDVYFGIMALLNEAAADLRFATVGPLSRAINSGSPFEYYDEIRKKIETARQDLFFVDPYLNPEFVSRYLPLVDKGVTVRLLSDNKLPALLSAVETFVLQTPLKIEVRSSSDFHDRYFFVDKQTCFHSGGSFKDGAKKDPTTLTQITDAFSVVLQTYETIWSAAQKRR